MKKEKKSEKIEEEDEMNKSLVDSDEDHNDLMENLMEKQNFDLDEEEWLINLFPVILIIFSLIITNKMLN